MLLNNLGGSAQINCLKQFLQFGMGKEMALGGALFELEAIRSVPKEAQAGWWVMEWYWNQPTVPAVKTFVDAISPVIGKKPTARHWMSYVSLHAIRLAAEKAKSLNGLAMSRALADLELPPDVSLMDGNIRYRAGDHQLMSNVYIGQAHPPEGDPDNLFTIAAHLTGEQAAGPVEATGCKMVYPS